MNKQALQAIKRAFIFDEKYQALVRNFKATKLELTGLKNLKVPQEIYLRKKNEKIDILKRDIQNYVKNRRKELNETAEKIIQSYKPTEITDLVQDPTQELLRRQNLQARMDLMNDNEIIALFRKTHSVHYFDLSIMKKESEKRGIMAEFGALYERATQPYLNNPEYQAVKEAESLMILIDKPGEIMLYDYDEHSDNVSILNDIF